MKYYLCTTKFSPRSRNTGGKDSVVVKEKDLALSKENVGVLFCCFVLIFYPVQHLDMKYKLLILLGLPHERLLNDWFLGQFIKQRRM